MIAKLKMSRTRQIFKACLWVRSRVLELVKKMENLVGEGVFNRRLALTSQSAILGKARVEALGLKQQLRWPLSTTWEDLYRAECMTGRSKSCCYEERGQFAISGFQWFSSCLHHGIRAERGTWGVWCDYGDQIRPASLRDLGCIHPCCYEIGNRLIGLWMI